MRAEKQLLLDEIKDHIDRSTCMILTSYQNMNPNMASAFRAQIAKSGGTFEVVRKRILMKAAAAAGFNLEPGFLEGHIGIVFALEDPVQVTKALFQYSKDHEEVFKVLGGRFEGQLCSQKDVEQISKLPGKDEMRSQFLGLCEAPLSQTLSVMESLLTAVIYCLENKVKPNNEVIL